MQVQVADGYFTGDWLVTMGHSFFFLVLIVLRHPVPTIALLLQHLL